MMKVKQILILALVALMSVSCLKGSYHASYRILYPFDVFTDEGYKACFGDTGRYIPNYGFDVSDLRFFNTGEGKNQDWKYTSGFTFSSLCDSTIYDVATPADETTPAKKSSYSVFSTTGANKSKIFGVYEQAKPESQAPKVPYDILVTNPYGSMALYEVAIANTTEVVNAIVNGIPGVQEPFADGDFLKIVATGYTKEVKGLDAEIYLADYRGKQEILKGWTVWKDISKLGTCDAIKFDIQVSEGKKGIKKIFCLDDFDANVVIDQ